MRAGDTPCLIGGWRRRAGLRGGAGHPPGHVPAGPPLASHPAICKPPHAKLPPPSFPPIVLYPRMNHVDTSIPSCVSAALEYRCPTHTADMSAERQDALDGVHRRIKHQRRGLSRQPRTSSLRRRSAFSRPPIARIMRRDSGGEVSPFKLVNWRGRAKSRLSGGYAGAQICVESLRCCCFISGLPLRSS